MSVLLRSKCKKYKFILLILYFSYYTFSHLKRTFYMRKCVNEKRCKIPKALRFSNAVYL